MILKKEISGKIEADLESDRLHRENSQAGENVRSFVNTNTSENSEITAKTNRAIKSEISSQLSKKLAEVRLHLNAHVLEVIISAIEERVLPTNDSKCTECT